MPDGPLGHHEALVLATLATGFCRALAVIREIAAAATLAVSLAPARLLLALAILIVLVALLACFNVLFVGSTLIGHVFLLRGWS